MCEGERVRLHGGGWFGSSKRFECLSVGCIYCIQICRPVSMQASYASLSFRLLWGGAGYSEVVFGSTFEFCYLLACVFV